MRGLIAFLMLAVAAYGQAGIPRIAREALTERLDGRPVLLSSGMMMTFYGEDLGPAVQRPTPIPPSGPYPLETSRVRALVDGRAAGRLYSGSKQINFKIPGEAPEDGWAPIQMCVHHNSSDPVAFRFTLRKAFLFPLEFSGAKLEVSQNGELLTPLRASTERAHGCTIAPPDSPQGQMPLPLIDCFDQPGVYSVRSTGRPYQSPGNIELATQSDWADIILEPYSAAQRTAWLQAEAVKAKSASAGRLVGDIIPSLLAWPDELALAALLTLVDHPDGLVRNYARIGLNLFYEDVQRRAIPANRWHDLHSMSNSTPC